MKIIQLSFILIVLLVFQQSRAQDVNITQYVGISTENFDYSYAEQNKSQWCWAASIQMLLNYYGINISQEEIVRRSYGADPYGNLPDWAGSFEIITLNLNNWSIDNNGVSYIVRSSFNQGPPEPAIFLSELQNQYPLLFAYQSSPTSGHAVIATGINYTETENGLTINSIIVRDPWPSDFNKANNGRNEYSGLDLARLITAHWYIRVERLN